MVAPIENWAELTGTVREVSPRADAPGVSELRLAVDEARDVAGFPNLLTEAPGGELAVCVDDDSLGAIEPGTRVRVRAQRAGPRTVVAHADGPIAC